jgi:hypothetical protein
MNNSVFKFYFILLFGLLVWISWVLILAAFAPFSLVVNDLIAQTFHLFQAVVWATLGALHMWFYDHHPRG